MSLSSVALVLFGNFTEVKLLNHLSRRENKEGGAVYGNMCI